MALTREQERSLWLHRVVTAHLMTDPDATMNKARSNLAAWRGVHRRDGMAQRWLDQWSDLLDAGVDAVAEVLSSRDARSVELRQNSPFAGVLDDATRTRVLGAFKEHWRAEHSTRPAAQPQGCCS
jgi:hypothetical protein